MNTTNFFQYPVEPDQPETESNTSFWAAQPAEDGENVQRKTRLV